MANTLDCHIIDVFTSERFSGNPAAVVMGADALSPEQMKRIAREFNLSETAFVLNATIPDAAVGMRFYTPEEEVTTSGHSIIAAVHGLIQGGRFSSLPEDKGTILPIQTKQGIQNIRCQDKMIEGSEGFLVWLDLERPQFQKKPCIPGLWSEPLDVPPDAFDREMPGMQTQDGDALVFVKSLQAVFEANPEPRQLAKFCRAQRIRGICLASQQTLTPSIHVQSRYFAPLAGVPEDAVCGKVHGPLAVYLVSQGLVPATQNASYVNCIQADSRGRAGLVRAVVIREPDKGYRVRIGAECIMTISGKLNV